MAQPIMATLLLAATAFPLLSLGAPLAAPCTKVDLLAAADAYVAAQTIGNLSALAAFAGTDGWTYVQNNQPTDPSSRASVLTKPLVIDHRRTNTDLVQCATYTELISASGPYVIGTQIHHSPSNPSKISLVDSVASTRGSWLFDAAKTLSYARAESWAPIPKPRQDARAAIKAAGDAYMDMWSDAAAHLAVPWGAPCARLEGGAYTDGKGAGSDTCSLGIPSNHSQAPNSRRRYVVDEEMGSVSILCVWEHMMDAADSHEFRLEGGRLRYVHTMTECGGRTCRL
ncbi:hypothetical protein GGTG_10599 [Gaeumannomyces tritici R3-111a-1]|uniref:DUF8021 domain-containing protein n=1 Tax=Gaeumannomyces tritici (strain R3-111a-1) TaxID=644352 RepID=J3PAS4_GAET3|nr:hypothetical protein GGTG_10599 [Gaeumannomyces tritici R3-111a-1]EJT71340.1 hypothetical protein GGTG_10599 [Gaeumannomyces tritici R3-111a-1]